MYLLEIKSKFIKIWIKNLKEKKKKIFFNYENNLCKNFKFSKRLIVEGLEVLSISRIRTTNSEIHRRTPVILTIKCILRCRIFLRIQIFIHIFRTDQLEFYLRVVFRYC